MQYQDVPTNESLSDFVDRLKRMDECIRRRKGQTAKPPHTAPAAALCSAPRNTTSSSGPSIATGTHPEPMNPSANKGKKILPEERDRRIRLGLCLHCSETGHIARARPKKNMAPGALRAAVTTTTTTVTDSTQALAAEQHSGNKQT